MPRVNYFDISADETERAVNFYKNVFDWKIEKWKGPFDYWQVMTGDPSEPGIDGGIAKREKPSDSITNFINVTSVDDFATKVIENGGEVIKEKQSIPNIGYFVICKDTENNIFGLFQDDTSAI